LRPWSKPSEKNFGGCDHGRNLQEKILGVVTMVETFGKKNLDVSTMVETLEKKILDVSTMVETLEKKNWAFRPWSKP
jgi:hypothetical protein